MIRGAWKGVLGMWPFLVALAVLLQFSLTWSIFCSVVILLYAIQFQGSCLRKQSRLYSWAESVKLCAIQEHLKITDDELREVGRRLWDSAKDEDRKDMAKDFHDVTGLDF
jgi:hypothetical protein